MTLKEVLGEATDYLKKSDVKEADICAWQLMEFVLGVNRSYYFVHSDDIMESGKKEQYMALIYRRAKHVPLQYITQKAYFMGHTFYVNENVLIPRLDTEVLVEEVGKLVKSSDSLLDMCTGSGCIAIVLKLEHDEVKVTGVDVSGEALKVACKNGSDLGADVSFVKSDLFKQVIGKFNIIVANPPYIRTAVIKELMPEVQDYEPHQALDGKEDGLYFYRQIILQAKDFLFEDGCLAFEIGYDQGDDLIKMMTQADYHNIRVIKDLAGLDRVVIGQR